MESKIILVSDNLINRKYKKNKVYSLYKSPILVKMFTSWNPGIQIEKFIPFLKTRLILLVAINFASYLVINNY